MATFWGFLYFSLVLSFITKRLVLHFQFLCGELEKVRGGISLSHLSLNKIAAVSQTAFSNAFSSMKQFEFWLKFHCNLFLRVQLTITQIDNSLAPNRRQAIVWTHICGTSWRSLALKLISKRDIFSFSYKIALRWMPEDLPDNQFVLTQVMAWWRQVTSHYLSQCLSISMSPYGVTSSQWVN